jgi:hypothetical protein
MGYLYVLGIVRAMLAGLCHSGVRSIEISHAGENFYPSSDGQPCRVLWLERNQYSLGIVQ